MKITKEMKQLLEIQGKFQKVQQIIWLIEESKNEKLVKDSVKKLETAYNILCEIDPGWKEIDFTDFIIYQDEILKAYQETLKKFFKFEK